MKSPCIDVCAFDKKTGWCKGCGRTKDECRSWKKEGKKTLLKIAMDLPRRLKKLQDR